MVQFNHAELITARKGMQELHLLSKYDDDFFQKDMHLIRIESCKLIFLQQLTAGCMASACMASCMAERAMASFLLRP